MYLIVHYILTTKYNSAMFMLVHTRLYEINISQAHFRTISILFKLITLRANSHMCTNTHIHIHAHTHIYTHMYLQHTHTHIHTHVPTTHTHMHTHTHTHMYNTHIYTDFNKQKQS